MVHDVEESLRGHSLHDFGRKQRSFSDIAL
jgi:hypothetical protein